jgi:hypothetical protein
VEGGLELLELFMLRRRSSSAMRASNLTIVSSSLQTYACSSGVIMIAASFPFYLVYRTFVRDF